MSFACGWRWPTGALPIHRVSRVNDERAVGLTGPADDPAFPLVCAIAAGLSSRASNATVLIKLLMIGPPEISAFRDSRCGLTADLVPESLTTQPYSAHVAAEFQRPRK